MRLRRFVSLVPLLMLGSACGTETVDDTLPATPGVQDSALAAKPAAGEGLRRLQAQRPEFFRGAGEVSSRRVLVDSQGKAHERVTQTFKGVPVFGAAAILHLGQGDAVTSVTDRLVRDLKVDTTPRLKADEAAQRAIASLETGSTVVGTPRADLQILADSQATHLTWRVQLEVVKADGEPSMPNLFIDAHTGDAVRQFDNLQTSRNRKTYTASNRTNLPGSLVRSEGQGPTSDVILNQAHDNAGFTYDFYASVFGRDSYDGLGTNLVSSVHYSKNYVNAFWNGTQMVYGDGDGVQSTALTVLDVVGHELTHAVTDTSSELIYANESGALNEAMSDIFGASIEAYRDGAVTANTWKIGEECWTPATAGDALRYMNDPAIAGDYDYYPTRYTGTSDSGGVHWNSGIANLAFHLLVSGGTHPRGKTTNVVTALDAVNRYNSIMKGAAIFYRANTVYLTPGATFSDARGATVQAATDLYGASAAASVNEAWTAVGVAAPPVWTVITTLNNVGGSRNSNTNFSYVTPAGAAAMKFELSGGTGDADMYVKFGSAPTTTSYDCRSAGASNDESCTLNPAKQGTYYVLIRGYTAYSGTTFKVSSGQ
ncbi:M4 family metallopeptidase [Corallococcus llansteffanensis]|uniref:Neutral metalloproteinase n=1 Tax=Corallococcus llansteffanensis TaxID=2316731 RepID=A0A3A8PHS0_9BACT|nr:M4 family metallopeptidase [Corallococcus llansteffanensis]RKH55873.1 bacillolysin [Corallococcus llansteffanensis]